MCLNRLVALTKAILPFHIRPCRSGGSVGASGGTRRPSPSIYAAGRIPLLMALAIFVALAQSPPTVAAANRPGLSPALKVALHDLSSDRYQTRQKGNREIQQFLAGQMAIMIQAVGPEKGNRVTKILRFNVEVSRWAKAVLSLPVAARAAMFEWGLAPKRIHIVAKAFSPHSSVRAAAAKAIAPWTGANADWLLLRLLSDTHRLVYLAAMDALWNHKPTTAMVRLIWLKVIANGGQFIPFNPEGRFVMFHGQKIIVPKPNNFWVELQDSVYAEQLMEHWNPPELPDLLTAVARSAAENPNGPLANLFANPGNAQVLGYIRLFRLAKPVSAVPYFLYLLKMPGKFGSQMNFNNTPTYWDSHTNVVYLLSMTMGRKLSSLGFFHSPFFGGRWLFHNKGDQDKATKTLMTFFKEKHVKTWTPPAKSGTKNKPTLKPGPMGAGGIQLQNGGGAKPLIRYAALPAAK